jgi:anti-sigma B factor antagonist
MNGTLTYREEGEVVVVDVLGRLTMGQSSNSLRALLRELAVAGYRNVLLNMAGVTMIDSAGIGEVIAGYTSLACVDGALKLLNVVPPVTGMVHVSRLDAVFEMFDSESEAILSFYMTKPQYAVEALRANLPSEAYIG